MSNPEELITKQLMIEDVVDEEELELQRISKLPFWQRIQEKGQEQTLKQVEETQEWAMESICKKDKIHKDDWKDEFILFWCGFLKGEYRSINQYLKRKNYVK